MTSGLSEKCWVLAIVMFAIMYNATFRGADGFTPWQRRFIEGPEFKVYPVGALVLPARIWTSQDFMASP